MLRKLTFCTLGLGVCLLLSGCGPKGSESADDHGAEEDSAHAAHAHPTAGPHGGHLIELGNEAYHAELLHDEGTHTVTIYLLDGPAKAAVAGDEEEVTFQLFQDGEFVSYALTAVPASGEEAERSHFALADETLCDTLIHADEVKGRLNVSIGGNEFTGMIEHHAHGDEGHEHGDGDGEDAHDHGAEDGDGHDEGAHGHGTEDGDGHDEDAHEHGAEEGAGHDTDAHDHAGDAHDEGIDDHGEHEAGDHSAGGHDEDAHEHEAPGHGADGHTHE